MKISLLVLGHPTSSNCAKTALAFAKSAITQEHTVHRVFFYHDAVHTASNFVVMPQDESNIGANWQQFGQENNIDMVVCIGSALKRGILNHTEAQRYNRSGSNFLDGFELSGLGQLVDAAIQSDRLITFGA